MGQLSRNIAGEIYWQLVFEPDQIRSVGQASDFNDFFKYLRATLKWLPLQSSTPLTNYEISGMLSACTNPILYGFLNENFKKEFNAMFIKVRSLSLGREGGAGARDDTTTTSNNVLL